MLGRNHLEKRTSWARFAAPLVLFFAAAAGLFAGGGQEPEWQQLDPTEHWQHQVDLDEFEPGTWNVLIRARDQGGNETFEGPFNLSIDPNSDLPISSIIYPEEGQIVRGGLSIVGVAVDDDAIGNVHVSIDDGPFVQATGAEYWRLSVDSSRVAEGTHSVRVKATDVNGLEGPEYVSTFIVDRSVPAIGISSHKPGELVGGNVQLRGLVSDVNGIAKASFRIPAYTFVRNEEEQEIAQRVQDIFLRHNQAGDQAEFDFSIATGMLPDGPRIIWLSATDRTGSEVEVPFLFFVDNNKPEIQILSPEQDSPNLGSLLITGTLRDGVGVERFWYKFGSEEVDVPLTPGNPYWTVQLDSSKVSSANTELEFFAEDASGNRASLRFRSKNNKEAARPIIELLQPIAEDSNGPIQVAANSELLGRLLAAGSNKPQLVRVAGLDPADSRVLREFPARYGFRIPLSELPPGRRQLSLTGVDSLGFESRPVTINLLVLPQAPEFLPQEIRYADGRSEPWFGWAHFDSSPRAQLVGTLATDAKLSRAAALFGPELAQADPTIFPQRAQALTLKASDGGYTFELPLDQAAKLNGLADLGVWTVDEFGAVSFIATSIVVLDRRASQDGPRILLPGLDAGLVVLGPGTRSLSGALRPALFGRSDVRPRSVELVAAQGEELPVLVDWAASSPSFTLRAGSAAGGSVSGVRIRVDWSDGSQTQTQAFDLVVDSLAPEIELASRIAGGIQYGESQTSFQLSAEIRDADRLARLEYSLDGGQNWISLPFTISSRGSWSISSSVDTSAQRARAFAFLLRAVDRAGNIGLAATSINTRPVEFPSSDPGRRNDTPKIELLAPVQNSLAAPGLPPKLVLMLVDLDGIASVEIAGQDDNWRTLERPNSNSQYTGLVVDVPTNLLSAGSNALKLRATDRLGQQSSEQRVNVNYVPQAARITLSGLRDSELQGQVFAPGESIELGGSIENAAFLRSLSYSLDGAEPKTVPTRNGESAASRVFTLQLPQQAYSGRFQTLVLSAIDNFGHSSLFEFTFIVLEEPGGRQDLLLHKVNAGGSLSSAVPNTIPNAIPNAIPGGLGSASSPANSSLVFSGQAPHYLYFDGPALASVSLPANAEGIVSASIQNGRVLLRPLGPGNATGVVFQLVDTAGVGYQSQAFSISSDRQEPELRIVSPAAQSSHARAPLIELSISDDLSSLGQGLVLEGRANGSQTWLSLQLQEHPEDPALSIAQSTGLGLQSGQNLIQLRARDASGKTKHVWLELLLDPTMPKISFVSPPAQDIVNGRTLVTASIESTSDISRVEISEDGQTYLPVALGQQGLATSSVPATGTGPGSVSAAGVFTGFVDFSAQTERELPWRIRVSNAAGSLAEAEFLPQVNIEVDLPELLLQTPAVDSVQTEDFTLSGMAFDDDGIQNVVYRFDNGEWQTLPGDNSFSVNVQISSLGDNEHVFEAYAVDTFGRSGPVASLPFKISLNEPAISMTSPSVDQTGSGIILLEGISEDENGIQSVEISLDNGTSFYAADGGAEWTYKLDSRVFTDGTYSVQIRSTDSYGVMAQYFSLLNVDNTAPSLEVSGPLDSAELAGSFTITGRVADAVSLVSLRAVIETLGSEGQVLEAELPLDEIIRYEMDVASLPAGDYNLRVEAVDSAGNTRSASKNLVVREQAASSRVYLLFPQEGELVTGQAIFEGRVESPVNIPLVQLYAGDRFIGSSEVNAQGYFRAVLDPGSLADGTHTLRARIAPGNGEEIDSPQRSIVYKENGPVLSIDSHLIGDFLAGRPWLEGRASYNSPLDEENPENRDSLRQLEVQRLRISLDNGRTWSDIGVQNGTWRYRVETGNLLQGPLAVILRAEYRNGETVSRRSVYTIDKTYPTVNLLGPGEGSLLNQSVTFKGTALDDYSLSSLDIAFRRGDKAGYSVPEFVQGMYLDLDLFGLTYWKLGLGFTFFDGSVKLQANFGLGPETTADGDPARLSGYFIGGKLLAKIFTLPFDALFGPDWTWLSLNFSIGADFSYILLYDPIVIHNALTNTDKRIDGVVLSAIVAQLEFPVVHFEDWDAFHTFSYYLEPEVWFVPSDVDPQIIPKLTMGFRIGLF